MPNMGQFPSGGFGFSSPISSAAFGSLYAMKNYVAMELEYTSDVISCRTTWR